VSTHKEQFKKKNKDRKNISFAGREHREYEFVTEYEFVSDHRIRRRPQVCVLMFVSMFVSMFLCL